MGFIASTYTAPYLAAHQQVVRDERVHVDLGRQLRQQLGDAVRLTLAAGSLSTTSRPTLNGR